VGHRVAGCPVTIGAPGSCHVGTSARASAVKSALHTSFASSVGTPTSRWVCKLCWQAGKAAVACAVVTTRPLPQCPIATVAWLLLEPLLAALRMCVPHTDMLRSPMMHMCKEVAEHLIHTERA